MTCRGFVHFIKGLLVVHISVDAFTVKAVILLDNLTCVCLPLALQ